MKDKDKILDDIFKDDPLGLLNVKPKVTAKTADERLVTSFQEINTFYEKNKRAPEPNRKDISEYKLYTRLKGLRENEEHALALEPQDRYDLLKVEKKEINSIEDIFGDDSLDILGADTEGLFDFQHVPKETTMPEYVAKRKPCEDFDQFEELFKTCHVELKNGDRQLLQFKKEQQIDVGNFFVLKGVLLYVAEVGKKGADKNQKTNARLRCIFENGTESDMLLRSLAAELYKDGRRVTEHYDKQLENFHAITKDDQESGYIYVLKSKSTNPELVALKDLFKIGYSSKDVRQRIRNAENEPTYLMAPVEYIAGWKCYNMNPQKFEQLVHQFFGRARLVIDVVDNNGLKHTPREWFIVPFPIIEEVVRLIINRQIVNYRYDVDSQSVVLRES